MEAVLDCIDEIALDGLNGKQTLAFIISILQTYMYLSCDHELSDNTVSSVDKLECQVICSSFTYDQD